MQNKKKRKRKKKKQQIDPERNIKRYSEKRRLFPIHHWVKRADCIRIPPLLFTMMEHEWWKIRGRDRNDFLAKIRSYRAWYFTVHGHCVISTVITTVDSKCPFACKRYSTGGIIINRKQPGKGMVRSLNCYPIRGEMEFFWKLDGNNRVPFIKYLFLIEEEERFLRIVFTSAMDNILRVEEISNKYNKIKCIMKFLRILVKRYIWIIFDTI